MSERLLAMSPSGRCVALRQGSELCVVDALGTAPRQRLAGGDFAYVGNALWVLRDAEIERYALEGLRPIAPAIPVSAGMERLVASGAENASTALVEGGGRWTLAEGLYDRVSATRLDVGEAARLFPLVGRRALATEPLRVIEPGRAESVALPWRRGEPVIAASSLFGGRAIAVASPTRLVVMTPTGAVIHDIAIPTPRHIAIGERRGVALLVSGERGLVGIDLRYGRVYVHGEAPCDVDDLALDADAQFVAFATAENGRARVLHGAFTDLVGTARPETVVPPEDVAARELADARDAAPRTPTTDEPPAPAANGVPVGPPLPDLVPRALGELLPPMAVAPAGDVPPYESAREHVDELLDVVAALAARAIADAWNSGRLSVPSEDARPFEREVLAILGRTGAYADDLVTDFGKWLTRAANRSADRASATIAAGRSLPFVELARELHMTPMAAQVLAVVMAPQVRGEIARLYGVLANDEHRPLVDRCLVELAIAGNDLRLRADVAAELAPDAPLVKYGLVHHEGDSPLFGALSVDPVVIDRVRGSTTASARGTSVVSSATRSLEELHLPRQLVRDILLALARPRPDADPLRLVLRGRSGSGRRSLVAALAARVDRRIASIDATDLARHPRKLAAELRVELSRAMLRRAVPVISGLESVESMDGDAEARDLVKRVLRAHPGPIAIRMPPEARPPLEPGYLSFTIPPASESERAAFWSEAVARAGLSCTSIGGLAQRFRIGPGTIEKIVETARAQPVDGDSGAALDTIARQHLTSRLETIATRVQHLASWEQVALPEDLLDSLKELVGRIRHRRTVYEHWGFDAKATTSRGLSALFYGPPGTGKSMVAGLVARELGLDLYKVDLSRVVSKWIGETEKHLSEIFDAAEGGQVVILFDEADSLFAKRTEVKSSVDRYANLEVNYLLQRLDTFEGICILTTNLDGSIDPAFKRRMSVRLQFPFPDEEMRVRLWSAHIPAEAPTANDFDFVDLSRRFPMSGGYIRNSTLRAAFLAAQEARPLSHEHLVRAVQLEYRELGKLSTSGRME